MAVEDNSRRPYIIDNDNKVKVGLEFPIAIGGSDGAIASTSTTIEAVKNNIRNLLSTNPGERLMQPNIGVELRPLLFEQIDESIAIQIQDRILDVFEFWLPFVEVRDIQVLSDNERTDINQVIVKIIFNIEKDPNTTDSVSVDFSSDIPTDSGTETTGGGGSTY